MIEKKRFPLLIKVLYAALACCIAMMNSDMVCGEEKGRAGHEADASPRCAVRMGVYENKPKVFTGEKGRPSGIFMGF
jgi:hypothetical protein